MHRVINFLLKPGAFLFLLLLSCCVVVRKKKMEKSLAQVSPEPASFCTLVKANISSMIVLKAQIGNTPGTQNFMFDTGAPLTYSFKTKERFQLAAKKLFRLGAYKFDYGTGSVRIGNTSFHEAGFLVSDYILDEYPEIDGLIGASLLQTSVCEINFADSTIKISNNLNNFTHLENSYACAFEPSEAQGTPVIKLALGKDTVTAFLDTGFPGFIKLGQKTKVAPEAAARQDVVLNTRYFGGSNKDHVLYRTFWQVRHMGLLGMQPDSLTLLQDQQYFGRNLVGLSFLKQFIVTIDWVHHRIYMQPMGDVHFKTNFYTYGFTCLKQHAELRVFEVYKGSALDKAGIKSGDVITSINNKAEFSEDFISTINSNNANTDSIRIGLKDKGAYTLKKYRLFE